MEMLSALCDSKPEVKNPEKICEEIVGHEELINMPYELGLAIPHTRSPDVNDLHIIIGIHKEGILLKECDITPSHIVVMCLICKATSNVYLLTLRAISCYFIQAGKVAKIAACTTPQQVLDCFNEDQVEVRHTVTASDIMSTEFPSVTKDASVKDVIDLFTSSGYGQVAVTDNDGKMEGTISVESILKSGIPEYILMLDNLRFLSNFEPFEHLLEEEDTMSLESFIDRKPDTAEPKTPLIQIIVKLVKREVMCYYVIDADGKIVGVINHQQLVKNVLRG